ncbi:MAG: phosphoribosylamine--glycine ligase [Clostridium sp.]|jgi:phosphoribosylamine--glycine ligase|nr:phosphoribosylamine--glycine ligase [Clostridium sp.]
MSELQNVFIIGGGGREHAIAQAIAKSKRVRNLYCAPGNAGIAKIAHCEPISPMDFSRLIAFAREKEVDFVIIGMDAPIVAGLADEFRKEGIRVFAPSKEAAMIEGSKAFSKDLMKKYHIPTARYEVFHDPKEAKAYLQSPDVSFPIVLKSDGLAAGKGVIIAETLPEALEGVHTIMEDRKFGSAGDALVIEEYLIGREVSVLAFVDGKTVQIMASAQDHKRALDHDQGLNTGGMGTFSPSPFYTKEVDEFCKRAVYQATVDAMCAESRPFVGILFFGLILTQDGPKVLEYNARFGDPETQVVLPRMKNDLLDVCEACVDGRLDQITLEFEDNAAVCVVLASGGYPESYQTGYPIQGLEQVDGRDDLFCFHAGTKLAQGSIVTDGGRVLGITALAKDLHEARSKAYEAAKMVTFSGVHMRSDIGKAIDEIDA